MMAATSGIGVIIVWALVVAANPLNGDHQSKYISRRDDCHTLAVEAGDTCDALAGKCGISPADFTSFNSDPSTCATLTVGQLICCSAGTKPSRRPAQNADGSCSSYAVQSGDSCSTIAAKFDITAADLSNWNDRVTWGWTGCNPLRGALNICLSPGAPPLPPPVDGVRCGPQKPGTVLNSQAVNDLLPTGANLTLASLNPCPLNACCDIWGQCGITPEFCTAESGPTNNPGTAPPGRNGCVSNCGTDIANIVKPASPINVGYYESWNFDRPCLTMRPEEIDLKQYTHLHWAFADVSPTDFTLSINDTYGQWSKFKALQGVKKVVSIGGWGFSTAPTTWDILRRGMTGDNSKLFAQNVINFLNSESIDGIDIDWEYPGAPDNQGELALPAVGDVNDGSNYGAFLANLRQIIPAGKTISIAAPSSFWYLQPFPIGAIQQHADYVVFMTYDLHGQWDAANRFSMEGCPGGNCLRSHVNSTETGHALAMITKAGISTDKVVVGISSYGRSFGMTDSSCTGPLCNFKGDAKNSAATPGRCTGVAGYVSNAEIAELTAPGCVGCRTWYDADSQSDMATYGDSQWVAYMTEQTRASRKSAYLANSFAGTADWAVDLLKFSSHDGDLDGGIAEDDDFEFCDPSRQFSDLAALVSSSSNLRSDCIAGYAMDTLITMMNKAYQNYTSVDKGYDDVFGYYVKYIERIVPLLLDRELMFKPKKDDEDIGFPARGDALRSVFSCRDSIKGTVTQCSDKATSFASSISGKDARTQMTLTDSDGFFTMCEKNGIAREWIGFGDHTMKRYSSQGPGRPFIGIDYRFSGYPSYNTSQTLPNPKDLVTKGLGNIPALIQDMQVTAMELIVGAYIGGSLFDPADAYSGPLFALMTAVDGMAQAKKLANDEKKLEAKEAADKIKNIVLLVVSVVLMFVPFAGEALASASGIAAIGRIAALTAEVSQAGLALYDTVENPSSAFVNAIGLLIGVGSLVKVPRTSEGLEKVATARRLMQAGERTALGKIFAEQDGRLLQLKNVCRF